VTSGRASALPIGRAGGLDEIANTVTESRLSWHKRPRQSATTRRSASLT